MQPATVNVLLVDDQPSNLLATESVLADLEGVRLLTADSGRKALRHLLDEQFAVVLLDVQMPDLDGFETAALIRQRERSRDTPIIFVTALSRSETNVFRGYELGAVDYIFKPFPPEILRSKVKVFVELSRHAQQVRELSRRMELILNAAADGVVGVDLDGLITFANPAAARMLGYSAPDLSGRYIHDVAHPRFPGVMTCNSQECALFAHDGSTSRPAEETFFRSDGRSFPAEYCYSTMRDETGRAHGAVVTFRDISERRAAAAAAETELRYREADAQNRAKDHFLATLSHELRTPMTSILGWVQFLRSGHFSEVELHEALATIEASARLQARLIDDMLDVSRIVLGKFQVELRPTHIRDVVDAALTTARPMAAERGVRLTADVNRIPDDVVMADAARLQQVIGNVLSNAIKFTPPGKSVDLRVESKASDVMIRVSDEGEGIEPSFLPHVFERLRQGEGPSHRTGLGLGLAIARHIVDL
ncbi:MAG TPA: response regulator, partial [Thermoanaerobaculia bacterium]|nr:response regulator [Thermoanaerobaculia bacterium]